MIVNSHTTVHAKVAQPVEHFTRNEGVVGSSPIFSFIFYKRNVLKAGVPYFLCAGAGKEVLCLTAHLPRADEYEAKEPPPTRLLWRVI